ncbi:MAG: translation initiation factor IF-2 N-terminal domain-containing protein, partial [Lachnospiraceae bacterium]|nr:translation initiation factor IF-2 N-terminal domain-containing protein [Lachnospiraceae bacterium]
MAKMKVFKLAEELGVQSKEIIAFLQGKGYEVKVAQSSIEDEAIGETRKHFDAKAGNVEKTAAAAGAKSADEAETGVKAESAGKAEGAVKAESAGKAEGAVKAESAGKAE